MTTKQIKKALNEFDLFNTFIPLKEEVLHDSLIGKEIHIRDDIYYLNNVEDIKRYYVNEICYYLEYEGSEFRISGILRSRIESLLNALYSSTISENIIDVLTEFIVNGFEENNNQ